MNKPAESRQLTLVELVGYLAALAVMVYLLRWCWARFDGIGLVVALISPVIGLLCGGLLVLLFAWTVFACGYVFSPEFRHEIREARTALHNSAGDEEKEN